jgi:hypothetical protein
MSPQPIPILKQTIPVHIHFNIILPPIPRTRKKPHVENLVQRQGSNGVQRGQERRGETRVNYKEDCIYKNGQMEARRQKSTMSFREVDKRLPDHTASHPGKQCFSRNK